MSSRICQGSTMNCDSSDSLADILDEGSVKVSHLLLLSLEISTFCTDTLQCFSSADTSRGFSQNSIPLEWPRAWVCSYPPNCMCTSLPPGAEQKPTTSSCTNCPIYFFISPQMWLSAIRGPRAITPSLRLLNLSLCLTPARFIVNSWYSCCSMDSNTYMKQRRHPQNVYPYKLETFSDAQGLDDSLWLFPLGLPLPEETMNSGSFCKDTPMRYSVLFIVSGNTKAMSEPAVLICRWKSIQALTDSNRRPNISITFISNSKYYNMCAIHMICLENHCPMAAMIDSSTTGAAFCGK